MEFSYQIEKNRRKDGRRDGDEGKRKKKKKWIWKWMNRLLDETSRRLKKKEKRQKEG